MKTPTLFLIALFVSVAFAYADDQPAAPLTPADTSSPNVFLSDKAEPKTESEKRKQEVLYRGYRFKLKIDGVVVAHFAQCDGLNVRVAPIAPPGGPEVNKLPGPVEGGEITLRYGLTKSSVPGDWFIETMKGGKTIGPKSVAIVFFAEDGRVFGSWELKKPLPTKWESAAPSTRGGDTAIEALTISYEQLEIKRGDD